MSEKPLCALCLAGGMMNESLVTFLNTSTDGHKRQLLPVEFLHHIRENEGQGTYLLNNYPMPLYADTVYQGTQVCAGLHLNQLVANTYVPGYFRRV